MKIITFGSLKGGTGKTSITLFVARVLAACGYKILVIDLDLNNSTSFTLMPENIRETDRLGQLHIAAALQSDNLFAFAVPSNTENIDLIRSSLYLVDLRTISVNRLKNLLDASDQSEYDYVIIDQPPTYDNITLMANEASDVIVTPVLFTQFDYNTSLFLKGKLQTETGRYGNWHLLFNGYIEGRKSLDDYISLFYGTFSNMLNTKFPWTTQVKNCIDRRMLLGHAKENEKLRSSVCSLASEITGQNISPEGAF
jgi:chromosome partitioning protein